MKKIGILASDMNSLLADLSEEEKNTAIDKFKYAKEKSYDSNKRIDPDFTKEEKEYMDDELEKVTYNGKYSGRDKNDNVKPMIEKLNNFVKCVNDKLKSDFSNKYYCSYNINKISLLFSVYEIYKWENDLRFETDFYAYVDREKDDNNVTLNKLADKIESLVSEMNVKYGDILKECVKELKSDDKEAVEECGIECSEQVDDVVYEKFNLAARDKDNVSPIDNAFFDNVTKEEGLKKSAKYFEENPCSEANRFDIYGWLKGDKKGNYLGTINADELKKYL